MIVLKQHNLIIFFDKFNKNLKSTVQNISNESAIVKFPQLEAHLRWENFECGSSFVWMNARLPS